MSSFLDQTLASNIYHQPIIFSLAIVTNILNIFILTSRTLRPIPCTHYFLAYSIYSIIYICLACPTQMLRGFGIDWANEPVGCKMHFYLLFLFPAEANTMLLFASFDRYFSSCRSRQFNSNRNVRMARMTIIVGSLLTAVYMAPMLMIYSYNEKARVCTSPINTLVYVYVGSQILVYFVLSPLVMIICGILTIINIRHQARRLGQTLIMMARRRTEGQLARMLLLQIGVHLILTLPFGVFYALNSFDASTRTARIIAIRFILVTGQQIDYFISFFLYALSASTYREELYRILKIRQRRLTGSPRHQRIYPASSVAPVPH